LPEGQRAIEEHLEGVELLILDNLSTLCRSGKENEAESWQPIQDWLLSLRRRGLSVLLLHHGGKSGTQRGTSKREDILDTVICLKRPADYDPEEGARFEVHYEKARGLYGQAAAPFEAKLAVVDGALVWTCTDIETAVTERVAELLLEGRSQRAIARELDISLGAVNAHVKRAKQRGLVK
jgi:putative DNA primase/helicase